MSKSHDSKLLGQKSKKSESKKKSDGNLEMHDMQMKHSHMIIVNKSNDQISKNEIASDKKKILQLLDEMKELVELENFRVTNDGIFKRMNKVKSELNKMATVDHKLSRNLVDLIGEDEIYNVEDYSELEKNIKDTDTILYFKDSELLGKLNNRSAEMLKICTNIGMNSKRFNEGKNMYEVVRDNQPQKITIISDCAIIEHHKMIQEYICEYMEEYQCKIKEDDVKCLKNKHTGDLEILITNYYVANAKQKEEFISGLRKYIRKQKGDKTILKYLGKKDAEDFDMDESASVMLPYQKEYCDGKELVCTTHKDIEKLIVGAIKKCKQLNMGVNGPVTINIGNINIGSTVNGNQINGDNNTINNISVYDKLIFDLISQKPKWYITDKFLSKKDVYKKMSTILPDHVPNNVFWQNMKNKLIDKEKHARKDNGRELQIKLKRLW